MATPKQELITRLETINTNIDAMTDLVAQYYLKKEIGYLLSNCTNTLNTKPISTTSDVYYTELSEHFDLIDSLIEFYDNGEYKNVSASFNPIPEKYSYSEAISAETDFDITSDLVESYSFYVNNDVGSAGDITIEAIGVLNEIEFDINDQILGTDLSKRTIAADDYNLFMMGSINYFNRFEKIIIRVTPASTATVNIYGKNEMRA